MCDRVAARLLVLVAPMIPMPREAPADYWTDTRAHGGTAAALRRRDRALLSRRAAGARVGGTRERTNAVRSPAGRAVSAREVAQRPTRVVLCGDDRLLPRASCAASRERLGVVPDEIDGGHTPTLSHPAELAGAASWRMPPTNASMRLNPDVLHSKRWSASAAERARHEVCGIGQPERVTPTDFVPPDFAVPTEVTFGDVRLLPLGPEHNSADHAAWTSSIDHIRATPGFAARRGRFR